LTLLEEEEEEEGRGRRGRKAGERRDKLIE